MDLVEKKINVVFLLYSMTGGGAERVASILLRELEARFNLHLVLINGPVEYALPRDIPVTILRHEPRNRMWRLISLIGIYFRFRKFCKKNQIDVSMSFDNLPNYINAALALGTKRHPRLILTEHNPPSIRYRREGVLRSMHSFLIRWLYPKADSIIPCSLGVMHDLKTQFLKGDLPFHPIYNPIDTRIGEKEMVEKADDAKTGFVFIHVGSFREQKNHALLIRAFKEADIPETQLWLIGKGPFQHVIEEQVRSLGLGTSVRFLGFQADPYRYMRQADCFVLSSDYEGFPVVLLEALACGLPIISTDCPYGPREILVPGTDYTKQLREVHEIVAHGILTPVGDVDAMTVAIRMMWGDDGLRQTFVGKVGEGVMRFDVGEIARNFSEVIAPKNMHDRQ